MGNGNGGKMHVRWIGAALLLASSTAAAPAMAAGPAVSETNAKLSAAGGSVDGDGTGLVTGSVSTGLGQSYGLQLDAAYGNISGDDLFAGGAHLFWRDPSVGLLGLIAS